jgi:hypothetical protein
MKDYVEKKSRGQLKNQEYEYWKDLVLQSTKIEPKAMKGILFGQNVNILSGEHNALIAGDYFERLFHDGTKIQITLGNGLIEKVDPTQDFSVAASKTIAASFRNTFTLQK